MARNYQPFTDPSNDCWASVSREPTAYDFGFIPATGTKDLKVCVAKPLFGRLAVQVDESSLAFSAPRIGPSRICVITPKEANPMTTIHCDGYVLTDEPDTLSPMQPTVDAGLIVVHDAQW